jgi:hypothetical protein
MRCAHIQNLLDLGPIISELKYSFGALIRNATPRSTGQLPEVLARTDDFQDWFGENRDPGETFACYIRVAASETPEDHRIDLVSEV